MKRLIPYVVVLALAGLLVPLIELVLAQAQAGPYLQHRRKAFRLAGGAAYSEAFNCANSDNLDCDLDWTEDAGDTDINSNAADLQTTSYAKVVARCTGQTTTTANQYIKSTLTLSGTSYPDLFMRMSSSASSSYSFEFKVSENTVVWLYNPSSAGSATEIASSALTVDTGDTFGVTVTGTGDNTEIRIWRNPTGLALSATDWNGDVTPDVTFTTNPGANAVDNGTQIGIGGYQSTVGNIRFDDVFFGDLP